MGQAGSDDDVWQEMAGRWERRRALLWAATREVSEWLVDRLGPKPGETVLELAAGAGETGFLAAARLDPGGRLISSDRSPNMVEAAARLGAELGLANVEYRILDSERTGLADASVDGVLCRFGYLIRGDPPRALQEARRVLRPGGRLAFSVWGERARNPWLTVPRNVMVERGHLPASEPAGADPLRERSESRIEALLRQTGFGAAEIEGMAIAHRFADSTELWTFVSELRGPIALALDGLDDAERRAVRSAIEEQAPPAPGGGYLLTGYCLNVLAV